MTGLDIAAARAELADNLEAALGIPVHAAVPTQLTPPLAYLHEADQFLEPEPDGPYGAYLLGFVADILIPASPDNAAQIREADRLAGLAQILDDTYQVAVSAYTIATTTTGQHYLTVPVTITLSLRL